MNEPDQGPTQRIPPPASPASPASAPTVRGTVAGDLAVFQPTEVLKAGHAALPPLAQFEIGTVLNSRYRIDALLGAGGMGVVYRAQDMELGRPVAVKFLSLRMMNDEQRALLINEVNFGLNVTHPNVCRIHSFERTEVPATAGVAAGTRIDFLCMEYVEGENLDALLRREGKLPREQALQIAQDLCAGLAAVHDKGMLHRDLKPSNIMIDQRGAVRLTDFGVAALAQDAERDGLVGTPGYLSPEALSGQPGTLQSDIYALGLVLCEIFTGKPVFKAVDVATQRVEISTMDLPHAPGLNDIEPAIRRIVLRCLEANPARRPRSVRDVAAALSEASIRGLLRKRSLILGTVLTAVILAIDAIGLLAPVERVVYDVRARHALFTPPPSSQIVHVDIDDASLEEIGHWPWPRPDLAQIIAEMGRAGPNVIAMDVVFPEPEHHSPQKSLDEKWNVVDGDRILGATVARAGNVLIPVIVPMGAQTPSLLHEKMVELLGRDLEQSPDQLLAQLTLAGISDPDLAEDAGRDYPFGLREAMANRVDTVLGLSPTTQDVDVETIRSRVLPRSFASGEKTAADAVLEKVLPQVLAARQLERFTLVSPIALPAQTLVARDVPVPELAEAARYCGFVNNVPSPDGVVRQAPLLIPYRGAEMPQLGLALACAEMGLDVRGIRVGDRRLVIPRGDGTKVSIPVHWGAYDAQGDQAVFMDIPWFGGGDWKTMYDYPAHQVSVQHMPITRVWDLCQVNREIEVNDFRAAADVEAALNYIDIPTHDAFMKRKDAGKLPGYDDPAAWSGLMDDAFSQLPEDARAFYLDPKSDLTDAERPRAMAIRNLQARRELNRNLLDEQRRFRAELRGRMQGKAVLIGAVASSMYDACRTPLQLGCPGVVVHGAIFSAILSGNFWQETPGWINLVLVGLLGLATTALVTWLPPRRAMAAAGCLWGGYLAINVIVLFDWRHLIAEATGPLAVVAVVWSVCSVVRLATMLTRARVAARGMRK